MANKTPSYFKAAPKRRVAEKKVRSMPVSSIVTLARATSVTGEMPVPAEARACPVRPALNKDGSARLNAKGERIDRVVTEIRDYANTVLDYIEAGWLAYAEDVKAADPKAYADAISEEQAAAVQLIASDSKLVADAKAARAKALEEEQKKAVSQAEHIVKNAGAPAPQTPKTPVAA